MLIIRLKPFGRKYNRQYRLVVADKKRHVTKKSLLDLGWYNPYTKVLKVNVTDLDKYIKLGTEMSQTVRSLLLKNSYLKA